jgi:hypothetical protein
MMNDAIALNQTNNQQNTQGKKPLLLLFHLLFFWFQGHEHNSTVQKVKGKNTPTRQCKFFWFGGAFWLFNYPLIHGKTL